MVWHRFQFPAQAGLYEDHVILHYLLDDISETCGNTTNIILPGAGHGDLVPRSRGTILIGNVELISGVHG